MELARNILPQTFQASTTPLQPKSKSGTRMQYRRRRGGSSQHKGLNKPPRRYKYSVGLASDKPPAVSIPESERAQQARSPSPRRLPPCSRPVVASSPPPLPRWGSSPSSGGCSSSPLFSSPPTRSTRLSHFLPLPAHFRRACSPCRFESGFGRSGAASAESEGECGLGAPWCVDLAVDSLICEV